MQPRGVQHATPTVPAATGGPDLRSYLATKSLAALKAMLRRNDQLVTGTRVELIERVIDRVTHGNLPRCPQCFWGRMRLNRDASMTCPGGYDDEYKACGFDRRASLALQDHRPCLRRCLVPHERPRATLKRCMAHGDERSSGGLLADVDPCSHRRCHGREFAMTAQGSDLVRFGVAMDAELLARFDARLVARGYDNRSEALRDLVRAWLSDDHVHRGGMAVGTLTLVYDHHVRELSEKLTEMQHALGERVVSTLHVHLDHDHCLEVIVLRGPADVIQTAADRLLATRGVEHGKLVVTAMPVTARHAHRQPDREPSR